MARSNPGVGPLKPHIRKHKPGSVWRVLFRDSTGAEFGQLEVTFMTQMSQNAILAKAWAAQRNARIVASRGPWNCKSVLPNG